MTIGKLDWELYAKDLEALYMAIDVLKKLEQQKYIELPFKVGDTVYTIENNSVKKWYVSSINNIVEYWKRELKSNKNKYKYDFRFAKFDDFGKTVFLTKEEAEAKLKELNKK